MFTGIVEELGTVAGLERLDDAARITIDCGLLDDVRTGDSIAVNGCCLTVTEYAGRLWTADVMQETLDKTGLGGLAEGDPVNLERALPVSARLGGHIVQGHVDGVGTVVARHPSDHWTIVEISLTPGAGAAARREGLDRRRRRQPDRGQHQRGSPSPSP